MTLRDRLEIQQRSKRYIKETRGEIRGLVEDMRTCGLYDEENVIRPPPRRFATSQPSRLLAGTKTLSIDEMDLRVV